MKALSIRLDDKLGKQFNDICRKTGYKKNTLVTRLIASFVNHQKQIFSPSLATQDPFEASIGSLKIGNLLSSEDAIDQAVYDL